MTSEEAAWVRAHVWTPRMRRLHNVIWPGYYTTCACQKGRCHHCKLGDHERCQPAGPYLSPEGMICDRTGMDFVAFAEPYKHRTICGAPRPTAVAQVWLADRVCRWVCSCDCGRSQAGTARAPELKPSQPTRYAAEQLDLLAL
ncbi:DUF6248 family natural product biosynthesis protein [Streptosporangium sp. NPDC051023]|uniref:DUF6248 family natural product biosynthesis protein n=1 Tax=Streptosporangium sp. NPDC051023 TaxID=3155410 RepID=UPI00344DC900